MGCGEEGSSEPPEPPLDPPLSTLERGLNMYNSVGVHFTDFISFS